MTRRNLVLVAAAVVAVVIAVIAIVAGSGDGGGSSKTSSRSTTTSSGRGASATTSTAGGSTTTTRGGTTTTARAGGTTTLGATTTTKSAGTPGSTSTTKPAPPTATELALRKAYSDGWTNVCHEIWNRSPEGIIFDGTDIEWQLDIGTCLDGLNELLAPIEGTAAEAAKEGRRDALDELWTGTLSGTVCWLDANEEHWLGCYDPDADKVVAPPES